jgi:copper homeostasis protein
MTPPRPILIETCVDSVASALAAVAGGARRLEVCSGLVEGGVTPSLGLLTRIRESTVATLHVLIRPRGGDFLYDAEEREVMWRDIAEAGRVGADGIVTGALTADGQVDSDVTRFLKDAAGSMAMTFHRAFDLAAQPDQALDVLLELGIERLLTSGQSPTAEAGIPVIQSLVQRSAGRIEILAGGGINASNARRIVHATGVREIHVRGSSTSPSPMRFRREGVFLGRTSEPDEYRRIETESNQIRAIVDTVNG